MAVGEDINVNDNKGHGIKRTKSRGRTTAFDVRGYPLEWMFQFFNGVVLFSI